MNLGNIKTFHTTNVVLKISLQCTMKDNCRDHFQNNPIPRNPIKVIIPFEKKDENNEERVRKGDGWNE